MKRTSSRAFEIRKGMDEIQRVYFVKLVKRVFGTFVGECVGGWTDGRGDGERWQNIMCGGILSRWWEK